MEDGADLALEVPDCGFPRYVLQLNSMDARSCKLFSHEMRGCVWGDERQYLEAGDCSEQEQVQVGGKMVIEFAMRSPLGQLLYWWKQNSRIRRHLCAKSKGGIISQGRAERFI